MRKQYPSISVISLEGKPHATLSQNVLEIEASL